MEEELKPNPEHENPKQPITLILPGSPPGDFPTVHSDMKTYIQKNPNIPPESDLAKVIQKHTNFLSLLETQGIQPKSTRIMKGPNNGILLFHITPDLARLENLVLHGDLKQPPISRRIGDRIFGPALAFHTDISTARQQLEQRELTQDNLLAIETQGMHSDYEITIKKVYEDYLTRLAQQQIQQNQNLKDGFEQICEPNRYPDLDAALQKIAESNVTFNISSLVIDTYNKLYPNVTRLTYRQNIQKNFEHKLPFGYRANTDPSFLSSEKLLRTVDFMNKTFQLPTEDGIKTNQIIRNILEAIKENPDGYTNMQNTQWINNQAVITNREGLILNNLIYEDEIKEILKDTTDPNVQQLIRLLDGWYPIGEPAANIFQRNEGIGTDLGSNFVGIIRKYNPNLHTILTPQEKEDLLKNQN